MTKDDWLANRLRTLDAAIPSPAAPDRAIGQAVLRERGRDTGQSSIAGSCRSRGRRAAGRRPASWLAAGSSTQRHANLGWRRHWRGSRPSGLPFAPEADTRIGGLFHPSATEAGRSSARGRGDDSCVSTAVASDVHAVWLLPGYSHAAAAMVETLQAELLTRCLHRDAAIEFSGRPWPASAGPTSTSAPKHSAQKLYRPTRSRLRGGASMSPMVVTSCRASLPGTRAATERCTSGAADPPRPATVAL